MTSSARRGFVFLSLASLAFAIAAAPPPVRGRGVVAADHELASRAGSSMFDEGGNAVDAVIAAALAAEVTQPSASGFGGGGFVVVRVGGVSATLDFREVAPAAATRDMYLTADGAVDKEASLHGGASVGVPGQSRGLIELWRRFGTLPLAKIAAPAISLAKDGFRVGPFMAARLAGTDLPEVLALFTIDGHVATEGEVYRRPALAKTLKSWVKSEGEELATGDSAAIVAKTVGDAHGGLTAADMAAYRSVARDPLVTTYRGYTIVSMGPPSSGGVAIAEILGVLEQYDLKALGRGSVAHDHLLAEVMSFAYADRAHFLGDPGFVDVPVQRLISPERRAEIQAGFDPARTFPPEHYGPILAPAEDAGTENITAIGPDGSAAVLTTTINTAFGSGVVVEELGFILNDQMDDFSVAPGAPNAYGMVGSEANAIMPGKRPLSSMSPTIVLGPDGEVVMAVGGSGGSQIISAVVQAISNVVDFQMDPQEAVSASRIHAQWLPGDVYLEPDVPIEVVRGLEALGHKVTIREQFSCVQLVVVQDDGLVAGGSDPRKDGRPVGSW